MNGKNEDAGKQADLFSALAGLIGSTPEHSAQNASGNVGTAHTTPAGGQNHAPVAAANGSESFIGPYKLLEQIGEGGMGAVYIAEQTEPVRRKVALKVIKPGMASGKIIARFEAERQALAMMDHPNIAKVFDAGTTPSGQPYFAMELVNGVPITKYCDKLQLSLRERLGLFIEVCKAIQHAHQKGVIHRDIKPSNVLVALQDGLPVPKVIDFGVAKALNQKLTDATLYTQVGALIGTLEYMSPEQAEMSALGIDARSDIYSLGVLLYELLTGSTPLNRKALRESALDELLRRIREEEPPKPSTRLTTANSAELSSIAKSRKADQSKLSRQLKGELDWIAMRALEKDRTRRYESANGLARDVERYLADEPVEACPPSNWYLIKKVARRNKASVIATGAVTAALVACVAMVVYFSAADREVQKEKRRMSFETIVRSAEVDDEKGESGKVIAALEPFMSEHELAQHPMHANAESLVARARDGSKRFAAFAAQIRKGEQTVALDLGKSVLLDMILIPAGTFTMGSPATEKDRYQGEGPQHEVTITKQFYMGKFTVTQEQYETVVGTNPSVFKGKKRNPVDSVNWHEAVAFCEKLSKQSGDTKLVFALPTEAQWEYACRAGTTTRYYFGDDDSELDKYAWFSKNVGSNFGNYGTQAVGGKLANPFGLYDMHGNVYQWCADWYDENYYKNSPKSDPTGPRDGVIVKTFDSEARVLRGCSWGDGPWQCRSALRGNTTPSSRSWGNGFRCALVLPRELQIQIETLKKGAGSLDETIGKPDVAQVGSKAIKSNDTSQSQSNSAPGIKLDLGNGVVLETVLVPAGTFEMGSPEREAQRHDDEKQHTVTISKPFYMGKFTVTQEQYESIMGANPSQFKGTKNPAETVSWDDAVEFCQKASRKTGKNFALPTEAQWEYACRAGTTTAFNFGAAINTDQANYNGNSTNGNGVKGENRGKTTPVGAFPANKFGLFDMHGNVQQWCQDWYSKEYYGNSPRIDPINTVPDEKKARVHRGGSWFGEPLLCRSAHRGANTSDSRYSNIGFRIVLLPD